MTMKVTQNPNEIPFLGGCAEADHRYHQEMKRRETVLIRIAKSIDTPEEMVAVLAGMDLQLDIHHTIPEWADLMWADLFERRGKLYRIPPVLELEATKVACNRLKNAPTPELARMARQQLELVKVCLGERYLGPE
jgi:hypothetical protein